MKQTYVANLGAHEGETVSVKGWLYNKRSSKKVHFLIVRDGSGIVQCVAGKGDISDEQFDATGRIPQESSIIVTGTVHADKRAPGGLRSSSPGIRSSLSAPRGPGARWLARSPIPG